MSNPQLNDVAQTLFDMDVHAEYQSRGFLLKNTTQYRSNFTGKSVQFRKMGSVIAVPTAYQGTVNLQDPDYTPHTATVTKYVAAIGVDEVEQYQVNFDVRAQDARLTAMAMGRRSDQVLIDTMNLASPNHSISAGGANFDYSKFRELMQYFDEQAVPPEDRFIALSANNKRALFADDRFINSRYTDYYSFMSGQMDDYKYLGFRMIVIPNMAEGGLPLSGNTRTCMAWHRDAFGMAVSYVGARIDWIGQNLTWQVAGIIAAGATEIDSLGFVKVLCDESVNPV